MKTKGYIKVTNSADTHQESVIEFSVLPDKKHRGITIPIFQKALKCWKAY